MLEFVEILGVIIGFIYLWLEYKASIYLWLTSIIMPAIYLFVYFDAGLYADVAINIYYLIIGVYGWVSWRYGISRKNGTEKYDLKISHTSRRQWLRLLIAYIVIHFAISFALINFTDTDVPWFNGLTSALSIIGMWMLAKKLIEQWFVWFVVDILSAVLYFYKGLEPTALLYSVYAIVAILGYKKWNKLLQKQYAKE